MGWRGTAILALLTVVVGAYLGLEKAPPGADRRPMLAGQPPPQEITTPARHLLDFQPSEVISLRLERGGQAHEVERTGGGWRGLPNATALDDLLHDLAELGVLMDIAGGQTALTDYGLDPPQGVLRLRLRGRSAPLILQLGDRNPATTAVYVRLGTDGPVVLAGALIDWDFDRAFKALAGEA